MAKLSKKKLFLLEQLFFDDIKKQNAPLFKRRLY